MKRILTGIQSTGIPHLGNLLGAMIPAIQLVEKSNSSSFFFIADLHTLTTNKDAQTHKHFVQAAAATWLACGLNPNKHIFYRQSHIPQVCELAWYLSCFTSYPTLAKAHAFKDKSTHLASVNTGLFTYPILMAADIILYDATHIPVGKDQQQHLEIACNIAKKFNHQYGEILVVPQAHISQQAPTIPGTDGRKMSKSYHNTISPFMPEKELYKTIMAIPTDSTPLQDPKDPDKCPILGLYRLLASKQQITTISTHYLAGSYGYSDAKKALFKLIIEKFAPQRAIFNRYMKDTKALQEQLAMGEEKARIVANATLLRVRKVLGY